jgi:hypothetical protein
MLSGALPSHARGAWYFRPISDHASDQSRKCGRNTTARLLVTRHDGERDQEDQ